MHAHNRLRTYTPTYTHTNTSLSQTKPVDERLRNLGGTKKLVIDVVKYPRGMGPVRAFVRLCVYVRMFQVFGEGVGVWGVVCKRRM